MAFKRPWRDGSACSLRCAARAAPQDRQARLRRRHAARAWNPT